MATPSPTRASPLQPSDWITLAFARLAHEGIDSVRVEVLARELGVSKGSFYWHFRDRDDLLTRMLSQWEDGEQEWFASEESSKAGDGNAAARWARFIERSTDPHKMREEIALRAWARKDERISRAVAEIERRKTRLISDVLAEIGFAEREASSWSEVMLLVYLGWLDRTARDGDFRLASRGLGEFLSDLVVAASAKQLG